MHELDRRVRRWPGYLWRGLCCLRDMLKQALFLILSVASTSILSAQAPESPNGEKVFIAVVGGTTFGTPIEFAKGLADDEGSFSFHTRAGPSPVVYRKRYKGVPFYYIPIYGFMDKPKKEPDGIYHVRTWTALYELGVTHAISGATSGGINPDMDFDDIVVIDDFIEWRAERPNDVLAASGHSRPGIFPNFEIPLSPSIRALLIDESRKHKSNTEYQGNIYETGTFVQFAPGRFESPAEIRAMRKMGGELTSMNQATCIVYARQFGIRYGSICSISNPAVGVRPFTFAQMQTSVQNIAAFAIPVVLETIARIPTEAMGPEPSSSGDAFEGNYLDPNGKTEND